MQYNKKFKTGVTSIYIVIFSTLLLSVIVVSFISLILSEYSRTVDAKLAQSAYDSALAGVEDAKLALIAYRNCTMNADNTIGWQSSVNCSDVKKYMNYFKKKNISYSYSDINSDVYYWGDKSLIDEGRVLSWAKREIMIKEYEDEDITNIFYYHVNPEDIDFILNVNKDAYISKWGNSGNICGSYVDKSFGVLKFCEVFGFTTDEVSACGDGSNDKEMLEMAGIGIAVANAKENTKKAADYVCEKPIEDGGLYEAFIDLKIIEESKLDKLLNIIK